MSLADEDGPESESKGPMGMAAPRAGGNNNSNSRAPQMKPKKIEEEDDFGDTDVSDLLG